MKRDESLSPSLFTFLWHFATTHRNSYYDFMTARVRVCLVIRSATAGEWGWRTGFFQYLRSGIVTSAGLAISPTRAVYAGTENAEPTISEGLRVPSREDVARYGGLVPIEPEPGPAGGDHTVNRQQPFGQNGACNVQIFEPGSRWRDGHHMCARLDKSVV